MALEIGADGCFDLDAAPEAEPPVVPEVQEEPAMEDDPAEMEAWAVKKSRADRAVREGNHEHATEIYTEALSEEGCPRTTLLANRALCHLKTEQFARCVEDCNMVLKLEPTNAKALFRKSKACHALGDPVRALASVRAAKKAAPNSRDIIAFEKLLREEEKVREAKVAAKVAAERASARGVESEEAALEAASAFLHVFGQPEPGAKRSQGSKDPSALALDAACEALTQVMANADVASICTGVAAGAARVAAGSTALGAGVTTTVEAATQAARSTRDALSSDSVGAEQGMVHRAACTSAYATALLRGEDQAEGIRCSLVAMKALGVGTSEAREYVAGLASPATTPETRFIASATFEGKKEGYYFSTGDQGTGYYLDGPQRPTQTSQGGKSAEEEEILKGLPEDAREGVRNILKMTDEQVKALPLEQQAQVDQLRNMFKENRKFQQQRAKMAATEEKKSEGAAEPPPPKATKNNDKDETKWLREFADRAAKLQEASSPQAGQDRATWEAAELTRQQEALKQEGEERNRRMAVASQRARELIGGNDAKAGAAQVKDPSKKKKRKDKKKEREDQLESIRQLADSAPKTDFMNW